MTTPEQDAAFERMFGVSRQDLRAKGLDPEAYLKDHFEEAFDRSHPQYALQGPFLGKVFWVLGAWGVLGLIMVALDKTVLRHHDTARSALLVVWLIATVAAGGYLVAVWLPSRRALDFEWKEESSAPLLPYQSDVAWIGRGRTRFSRSWLGSISIDNGILKLEAPEAGTLAQASVADVIVHDVRGWPGIGVRLDLQGGDGWFVQPRYSPMSPTSARRAVERFQAALSAAHDMTA